VNARLTSAIFVSSVVRRVNLSGNFATVVRHGSDDAGAVFICVTGRGAGAALYGPVPQIAFAEREEPPAGGRLFELLAEDLTEEDLSARFEKEARFDPDFWVVEVELFDRPVSEFIDIGD
jgi:hypothetical protein